MLGVRPVRVIATGPVAAVVFQLDGRAVSRRPEIPWAADVDFGKEYAPHELVARAFDEKGVEIALARQWINLPRPAAEVEILLDRDASGKAVAARLVWASRMGSHPDRVWLTFDGVKLPLDATHRAALPAFDPAAAHVLTAQVEFGSDLHGRADLVLGGGSSETVGSELTAVPIRSLDGKALSVEILRGSLLRHGAPLKVAVVEREPATLVLVRNLQSPALAWRLRARLRGALSGGTKLEADDRLQVQWPVVREISEADGANVIFEASRMYAGSEMSIVSLLTEVDYPHMNPQPRRFADAVAIAGLQAARYGTPRAVVLALGSSDQDASRQGAASIRRYLERLRVPLYVWSLVTLGDVPAAAWGSFEDVSTANAFRAAADRVRDDLRSQSIAWVEGRYLPQEITLAPGTRGVELVR